VRILLPPSETKNPGGRGASLSQRIRSGPLAAAQDEVLAALSALVADGGSTSVAAAALALPASIAESALADDRDVLRARTMPALLRYCGVVYDGLAAADFDQPTTAAANRSVLIFCGLFGVLRARDPVPPYRVPAKAKLPGIGVAGTFWRPRLEQLLPPMLGRGPVIDLRSSDYAAMWQPRPADRVSEQLIAVRIVSPRPDRSLGVISFPSKLGKGRLAAGLLSRASRGEPVRGPADVIEAWLSVGGKSGRVLPSPRGALVELETFTATL
jgi:cytoplasmic iron level regulating protein YaaA (DUF328/UPF0246 family)